MDKLINREALSGWHRIVFYLVMLSCAFYACTHAIGSGDTWVAMACGRHILNHGFDFYEPFSANSHKPGPTEEELKHWPQWIVNTFDIGTIRKWHPTGWINQNWLSHVIFYWLTHKSWFADAGSSFISMDGQGAEGRPATTDGSRKEGYGAYDTLVYLKFTIYSICVFCVYSTARVMGVNVALAAGSAAFSMIVARTFIDFRPAAFSNVLFAVYLLILTLSSYRSILYIWLIVPLIVFWSNVHGGYILAFAMLVAVVAIHCIVLLFGRESSSISPRGVAHTIGAGTTAFVAMILINPFHFSNLTHTYVVSLSEHARLWRLIAEWRPAYDWDNPVGDVVPFFVLLTLGLVLLICWLTAFRAMRRTNRLKRKRSPNEYQWAGVDPAMLTITVLTIYAAIQSRRFIPIAAIAACPVFALFADQVVRMTMATRNLRSSKRFVVAPMSGRMQSTLIGITAIVLLVFCAIWGVRFKRVYLDPWPGYLGVNSVFMRMTGSGSQPFAVCEFIRQNKLNGRVFNYWTEGGFLAYGQNPDPESGITPLQIFIDGRAQAAYSADSFRLWSYIYHGGPLASAVYKAKREPSSRELVQIGRWISNELRERDVWIVLVPRKKFGDIFFNSLVTHPEWRPVFINDTHRVIANIESPQGRDLYRGIFDGRTVYPDEILRTTTLVFYALGTNKPEANERGLKYAIRTLQERPSVYLVSAIVRAGRFPHLASRVTSFCQEYLQDFEAHKADYTTVSGYDIRLRCAVIALKHLIETNANHNRPTASYRTQLEGYQVEHEKIVAAKTW